MLQAMIDKVTKNANHSIWDVGTVSIKTKNNKHGLRGDANGMLLYIGLFLVH